MTAFYRLITLTVITLFDNLYSRLDRGRGWRQLAATLARERDIEMRRAESLNKSIGLHLTESVVMLSEIERLEHRNAYLESLIIYRREVLAGVMLTQGMIDAGSKMTAAHD